MHHEIVALEKQHQPLPVNGFHFPPGTTHELISYETTSSRDELHARIRTATIIITTTVKIDAATLHPDVTPRLRCVAVSATGTDPVDLAACTARGIRVTNCPGANLAAVSEHAISLYFAARRRTVLLDRVTRAHPSEWKQQGSVNRYMRLPNGQPPPTCADEVVGVVGYGGLGKRIAAVGRALGMRVLIAARKEAAMSTTLSADAQGPPPRREGDEERVPFDSVLRQATVLILSLPRNPQTLNLLSSPEFAKMHPHAVLINISRGGIVDEAALVQALKEKRIAGYATDVYQIEPLDGPTDTPLLAEDAKDLNITMSPHLAWFSQGTIKNLGDILKATIESWVSGHAINVIV